MTDKPIRLSAHARDQLTHRGVLESEIVQCIRTAEWERAAGGRLECHAEYAYNASWNGAHYATKRVRPIFVEEASEIVVVTVYAYYY